MTAKKRNQSVIKDILEKEQGQEQIEYENTLIIFFNSSLEFPGELYY